MRPVLAVALLALPLVACSDNNGSNPPPAADVTIVQGASAKTTTAYSPDDFTVSLAAGGKVTWVNADGTAHTVTADDGSFSSGNLGQNAAFSHTFTAAAAVPYHCAIHPGMRGTITVAP